MGGRQCRQPYGNPRREFLHVDDMAAACLHLLEHYDGLRQVNVGSGSDVTIKEIAETIARVVGFTGQTQWDPTWVSDPLRRAP